MCLAMVININILENLSLNILFNFFFLHYIAGTKLFPITYTPQNNPVKLYF